MPPTTIHTAPALDAYTALAEHQQQTPSTFFGAQPVLHYHGTGARALAPRDQVSRLPIFAQDAPAEATTSDENLAIETVDIFVGSDNLTIFNTTTSIGLAIPYPSISLHATQRRADPADATQEVHGLYMQLELVDPAAAEDDDEPEMIEVTLLPAGAEVQALFDAVSNCSNLHPDPMQEDDEMDDGEGDSRIVFEGSVGYEGISGLPGVVQGSSSGGLPPPFPGSGGWITAENVNDYFDAEGNFIGGSGEVEVLGEGAGRVRARDEVDGDGDEVNGHDETDENKRARTDG
ncbi:hypothetical protein BP6252_02137 [Coleophoma cylindrospora]|uniref:Benzoylformate decarboxylase n=1 Tax=Coleophoma cylindrospora TaxID=1849047 RepID=A0A3D8SDX4_9HELO|nr:hypothetical protein BP6252_02137 [Coleophoma cylindrospora]